MLGDKKRAIKELDKMHNSWAKISDFLLLQTYNSDESRHKITDNIIKSLEDLDMVLDKRSDI